MCPKKLVTWSSENIGCTTRKDTLPRSIDVCNAVILIEHKHPVAHASEDCFMGYRHKFEKPEAKERPKEPDSCKSESQRSPVERVMRNIQNINNASRSWRQYTEYQN
jgi:hypothetical protein